MVKVKFNFKMRDLLHTLIDTKNPDLVKLLLDTNKNMLK